MAVTLWPTGLVLTDEQGTRLDDYCVAEWYFQYVETHGGSDPPGWPAASGHRALAEWAIVELAKHAVRRWERYQEEKQIAIPE